MYWLLLINLCYTLFDISITTVYIWHSYAIAVVFLIKE
uniref:Heme exporter protein D (CcmD) n=1 Tax=Siphoviridae sp. ctNZc11 TaxID=2827858 RepID=A0A8S5TBS9_9CAUD|nr:MAG TPA: Heme exporter protein D (CcmD) [Siphoviridae sp. ctNZc11]